MSRFVLEREGTKVTVAVGSDLSAEVTPELRELLCAAQEDGVKELVLDFSQTKSLDAAGLALLIAAHNSFYDEQRTLRLVNIPRNLFALLEKLRLNERLGAQTG